MFHATKAFFVGAFAAVIMCLRILKIECGFAVRADCHFVVLLWLVGLSNMVA